MKTRGLFLIALVVLLVLPAAVSAIGPPVINPGTGMSAGFDSKNESVRVNVTYTFDDVQAVPFGLWLTFLLLGLGMMILSMVLSAHERYINVDLMMALLAIPLLFACALSSSVLDYGTSGGVTSQISQSAQGTAGTNWVNTTNVPEYVLIENHMLYVVGVGAIAMWIILIFAMLNALRIYVEHNRMFELMQNEGVR